VIGLFRSGLLFPALLLFGACGRPAPDPATPNKGERRQTLDRAATQFFAGPIQRFEITVSRPAVRQLRQEPRSYVLALVTIGSNRFDNVGIHLKGAAGSTRDFSDKPALTLNFDKFSPGQTCFGLDKLHLNNSVQDPSYLNELVASELYRRAGVPTARATHVLVTLNGRDLGLYVLKEGYDSLFLRRNFPAGTNEPGNLYDGGFLQDVNQSLKRDAGKGPDDHRDLDALVKAADATLSQRRGRLEATLDVDRFLTFLVGQTLTDDWDGYGRNRNNYRLYFSPPPGRAVFIPHGMDQLFREPGSSIQPGWSGLVAQQMMEIPEFRERYQQRLLQVVTNHFTATVVSNQFPTVLGRLRETFKDRPPGEWTELEREIRSQQQRVFRRISSVARQLGLAQPLATTNPGPLPKPDEWQARESNGNAALDIVELQPGEPALHLAVRRGGTVASFRTSLWLAPGNYVFSGRARVRAVKGDLGAGVRISGIQRRSGLTGDRDWTPLRFEFAVEEERDVELVVELGADAGEAWFEAASLQVTRR